MTVINIFDPTASPQTGIGDGVGAILQIVPKATGAGRGVDVTHELVSLEMRGTWSGVTATVKICNVLDSPQNWLQPFDANGAAVGSFTADCQTNIELPSGCYFTVDISGSGSPLPSLTVRAAGEIQAAS